MKYVNEQNNAKMIRKPNKIEHHSNFKDMFLKHYALYGNNVIHGPLSFI